MRSKDVRLAFLDFVFSAFLNIIGIQMEEQVPQFVSGAENPSLNGNSLPHINDNGRSTIILSHRQAKKTV